MPEIAGGRVTWLARGRLYAYDVRSKRRSVWRIPRGNRFVDAPNEVLRTRRAAIIAVTRSEECEDLCVARMRELYVLRLR